MASSSNHTSNNISPQQKERLLHIFSFPKYSEFAKVKPAKTKAECEEFWTSAAKVLNAVKPGSNKIPNLWRRSWRDLVNYTVKLARTKARVIEPEPGADAMKIEYTMDNKVNDKIMSLVGWELADISQQDDESDVDKENDPLYMPPSTKARKRSYSPLNFGESRTKSTFEPSSPMSPLGFDMSLSSPGSPSPLPGTSSAGSTLVCKCNCKAELQEIKQTLQQNTKALEDLVAEVHTNFSNLMIFNMDPLEPAQPAQESAPPVIVLENVVQNEIAPDDDLISEFLQMPQRK